MLLLLLLLLIYAIEQLNSTSLLPPPQLILPELSTIERGAHEHTHTGSHSLAARAHLFGYTVAAAANEELSVPTSERNEREREL